MKMAYFTSVAKSGYAEEIRQLLAMADKEFIPPLSARSSTTQSSLSGSSCLGGIDAYYAAMENQPVIVALENGCFAGFMAFKFDHTCEEIKRTPNVYASTCVVHPDHRGKGMMQKFYEEMIRLYPQIPLCTRTWSTNASHLRVLSKLGFSQIACLKDHRGPGLDTVYYFREPEMDVNVCIV